MRGLSSVSKIVSSLKKFNSLSQKEIILETKLSSRIVKYRLKELVKSKIVTERVSFCDLRTKQYQLNGGIEK